MSLWKLLTLLAFTGTSVKTLLYIVINSQLPYKGGYIWPFYQWRNYFLKWISRILLDKGWTICKRPVCLSDFLQIVHFFLFPSTCSFGVWFILNIGMTQNDQSRNKPLHIMKMLIEKPWGIEETINLSVIILAISLNAASSENRDLVCLSCLGFPGGTSGKEPSCQCWRHKRHEFDSWVGKIPWNREWQPTSVFLPGESPWTEEPGRLQSVESHRVRHDWSVLACYLVYFNIPSTKERAW